MKILIKRIDGGVTIMSQGDASSDLKKEIERWSNTTGLEAVSYEEVEDELIPNDRTFRNAWDHSLSVDMPKAKEIQRDILRELRKPLFLDLDTEALIALSKGDKVSIALIESRKKELRDITFHESIDSAQTPEELKLAGMELING